jgi:hypothetical protein
MLSQTDIQGRLRLLRYGLVVMVIVTFLVSLLAPAVSLSFVSGLPGAPQLTDFLDEAILFTVVVAILAVIVYSVYAYMLTKRWWWSGGSDASTSS